MHTPTAALHNGLVLVLLRLWSPYFHYVSCCSLPALHRSVSPPGCPRTALNPVVIPGSGEAFNVGRFLEETSPYAWASTGIGLCLGLSVLGAGWFVSFLPTSSTRDICL